MNYGRYPPAVFISINDQLYEDYHRPHNKKKPRRNPLTLSLPRY